MQNPTSEESNKVEISTISSLRAEYMGSTTLLTDDITIEGVVVANDLWGELSKSFIIADDSGGVEVECDISKIDKHYPIGSYLKVTCSGLWIGSRGGCIYLGGDKSAEYIVERLSQEQCDMHITTIADKFAEPTPIAINYNDLNDHLLQRLVKICDIKFQDATATSQFCNRDPLSNKPISTIHTLVDRSGNTIKLYVASTAIYANNLLPKGYTSLEAIVERYGSEYSLRLVNATIF